MGQLVASRRNMKKPISGSDVNAPRVNGVRARNGASGGVLGEIVKIGFTVPSQKLVRFADTGLD